MKKYYTLILVALLFSLCTFAQKEKSQRINIWQGTAVGKTVMMTPYLAKGKGNVAVIVCPGGSYLWHDMGAEGKDVGEWLQRNGYLGFRSALSDGRSGGFHDSLSVCLPWQSIS